MRPTIGRWHTRYRVAGEGGTGVALIESSVRERVAESYAEGLEQLFGADPAVYVLRRVETQMTVVNPSMADESAIARTWAERACKEVVHTVTRHGDDASQVMRFDDTAAFVAQWIADLLDGVAWDRWYYGVFAKFRRMSVEDAIRAALIEYREHLAAILRRLGAQTRLPLLLSRVSPDAARELWQSAIRGDEPPPSDEQFRVFLNAAFAIADALALWASEARPSESAALADFVASAPRAPDWKQSRELSAAVFAALAFLERRQFIVVPRPMIADVHAIVESFEWCDAEWLASTIEAWLREVATETFAAARPPALTALQQRLIAMLRQLIADRAVVLSGVRENAEHDALTLFAALAATEPQLASHPAAPAAIELVLREAATAEAQDEAIESAYAGVFLLSRALIDARIPQLAAAFGLPLPGVLRALAIEWEADPRDAGIAFWSQCDDDPDPLDPDRMELLRGEVLRLMRDRAAFAPSLMPADDDTIAACVLRLWAHWLPGVGDSSVAFLLRQFIPRVGAARANDKTIAVSLAPAPLDVVLEMAGYLAPIANVPWLGDRRMTFVIDRSLR